MSLIDSAINNFLFRNASANTAERNNDHSSTLSISLPFKDQVAANAVRKQLRNLSHKIGPTLQPVLVSKKLGQDLKPKEIKPPIVNKQCIVYHFSCDLCDADYVGYTARQLHQRIAEHKNTAIGRHLLEAHGNSNLLKENQFRVLRKVPGQIWLFSFGNALHQESQAQFKHPDGLHTCETFCLIFSIFSHVTAFNQLFLFFSIYRLQLTNIF